MEEENKKILNDEELERIKTYLKTEKVVKEENDKQQGRKDV